MMRPGMESSQASRRILVVDDSLDTAQTFALLLAALLGASGLAQNPPADPKSAAPAQAAPQSQPQARRSKGDSGAWLRKYKDMPPEEQEKALANDPYFRHLPAAHQQKLRQQLPGLALAGNGYRGIGVPDCVRSGQEAARQVLT